MRTWFHKHPSVAFVLCIVFSAYCALKVAQFFNSGNWLAVVVFAVACLGWMWWAEDWWNRP